MNRLAPLLMIAASLACGRAAPPPAQTAEQAVRERGAQVLAALAARDIARLATFAHPRAGIRFSPYARVDVGSDRVIAAADLASSWSSGARTVWGTADGSGEPLRMTFPEYFARFVFDHDFTRAPQSRFHGPPLHEGNAPSNLAAVYPDASWIEYHFPGFDPKYQGMDWSSLWLVFQRDGATWYLVGVVHGSWTI